MILWQVIRVFPVHAWGSMWEKCNLIPGCTQAGQLHRAVAESTS
jgi:hypothetical protein